MLTIDLTGAVALVLGGSRGIGAGVTETLCQAGAFTAFTHTGNPNYPKRVPQLLERIHQASGEAEDVVLDALDADGTTALADRVAAERGRLDVLVCNVGQNLARPAEEVTDEEWRHFIDINLTSAFYGVRAVLPHMIEQGSGRIVFIGSSVVYDGGGGAADYAAGKAGMVGMMRYLARNYTARGIMVNTIHPCVVDTDLLRERYDDEAKRQKLIEQVPAGRLSQPRDVAGLVTYLASDWGSFICGQEILVDGGRTFF